MLAERIHHYRIIKQLGAGGMGEVYQALDEKLDRMVALKVIGAKVLENSDARERFRREARATAKLNHPNIVQVHQLLEWQDRDCIVMELVQGESFRQMLRRGPLGVPEVLDLGSQIADGLTAAHAVDLIHRDLKAENVMVTADARAKILDFGLVKQLSSEELSLSVPGTVMGTLHSMAPEQAQGHDLDPRCDLFALGVLLYEALTGKAPFLGRDGRHTITLLLAHRQAPVSRLVPSVPQSLSDLVDQLLEKPAQARPSSAKVVADTLREIHRDSESSDSRHPQPSTAETLVSHREQPTLRSSEVTEVLHEPRSEETPRSAGAQPIDTPSTQIPLSSAIRIPSVWNLMAVTLVVAFILAIGIYSTWDRIRAERFYRDGTEGAARFELDEAAGHFQDAVDLRAEHSKAWTELAYVQWQQGFDIDARRSAQRAVETASGSEVIAAEAVLFEIRQDWLTALDRYYQWIQYDNRPEIIFRIAQLEVQAGSYDKALQALESLPEPQRNGPQRFLIEARLLQADEKFEGALELAEKAEQLGASMPELRARALLLRTSILQELGRFDEADELLEALRTALQLQPKPRFEGEVLELQALKQERFGVALRLLDDAILSHRSIGHQRGEARAMGSKGNFLLNKGESSQAETVLLAALQLAKEVGSRRDELIILNSLGYLNTVRWKLDQALGSYEEAKAVAQALGEEISQGTVLINIAEIRHRQGRLAEATDLWDEAVALHEKNGANLDLVYDTLIRARILLSQGDLRSTRQTVEEALKSSMNNEQDYEHAQARLIAAQLNLAEGNPGEAEAEALSAEESFRDIGSPPDAAGSGLFAVKALIRQQKLASARSTLGRISSNISGTDDPWLAALLDQVKAELQLAAGGDPRSALADLELTITEAEAIQAMELYFELKLLAAEAELRIGLFEEAGDRLRDLKRQAEDLGFRGLAKRAENQLEKVSDLRASSG